MPGPAHAHDRLFRVRHVGERPRPEGCGSRWATPCSGWSPRTQGGRQAPKWLVVRNCSDPQINGDLPTSPPSMSLQATWAVWYYQAFGYWTSVNSALATWGVIAGLA